MTIIRALRTIAMTSEPSNSSETILTRTDFHDLAAALHAGKPWAEWTEAEKEANRAHRERVRVACVEEYSSNPLHQARAAKDPDYWNSFSIGQANLFPPKAV